MQGLFARTIGTEDPETIEAIVDPRATSAEAVEVRISWLPGEGPPPTTPLKLHSQSVNRQFLRP